jgi:hypothetical protein
VRTVTEDVSRTLDGLLKSARRLPSHFLDVAKLEKSKTIIGQPQCKLGGKEATNSELYNSLVGQTMAGKSTFVEYIRRGDGSLIGDGTQNFTTECTFYPWNHMLLADTPGIAAFKSAAHFREVFYIIISRRRT